MSSFGDGIGDGIGDEMGAPESDGPGPFGAILDAETGDPVRRLGFALLAWAPLGIVTAAAINQATGCATYSAACTGAAPLIPWLAQAIILGMLLLIPAASRLLAAGTLAIVLALLPATGFLVAFGGAGQPEAGFALAVLLGVAWAVGIGAAIAGWRRSQNGRRGVRAS